LSIAGLAWSGSAREIREFNMKKSLSAMLLAIVVLPMANALAQDATSEAAIRSIVAEQVVAWNAGDGTRYANHLAPDASFTNLFGMVTYGAPAFARLVRVPLGRPPSLHQLRTRSFGLVRRLHRYYAAV
jgi:hypothetical protein